MNVVRSFLARWISLLNPRSPYAWLSGILSGIAIVLIAAPFVPTYVVSESAPLSAAEDPYQGERTPDLDKKANDLIEQEKVLLDQINRINAPAKKAAIQSAKAEKKASLDPIRIADAVEQVQQPTKAPIQRSAKKDEVPVKSKPQQPVIIAATSTDKLAVRKEMDRLSQEFSYLRSDLERSNKSNAAIDARIAMLEKSLGQTHDADLSNVDDLKALREEFESLKLSVQSKAKKTETITRKETEKPAMPAVDPQFETKLNAFEQRMQKLEATINELSDKVADLTWKAGPAVVDPASASGDLAEDESGPLYSELAHNAVTRDLPIIEVSQSGGADLWSGPEEEDKVILHAPQGARMALELAHEDWFRVITPQQSRAWIQARYVVFRGNRFQPNVRIAAVSHS